MHLRERGKSTNEDRRQSRKRLNLKQVRNKIGELKEIDQLRLSDVFDDEHIHDICRELKVDFRDRSFTPANTLGLFVSQVLNRDEPCTAVITRFNRTRKDAALMPVSTDASAYCKARGRLPLELIERLTEKTTDLVQNKTPSEWKWKGRNVYLVDGLVVSAPDTAENQEVYPQPSSQKDGLGFPQIRMVITTSLATGCVLNYNTGTVEGKKTGEVSLFREKHGTFSDGDVVIGDSNFESFTDAAMLKAKGVDLVCCINGTRESPFTGPCEEIDDQTITIPKPKFDSNRFTREQWESLPDSIDVRIIRYTTSGRNEEITIVTTLTDREHYPAEDITQVYGYRWDVELDIRSIKTAMGMDKLRCLTPVNLDREIAVHVLAHNLVRWLMCDTAKVFEVHPREISFSIARDAWLAFADELETTDDLMWIILSAGSRLVRNRLGRNEPRAIKRRQSKYEKLKTPRPSRLKRMAAEQASEP
jgi:hypothetical protein